MCLWVPVLQFKIFVAPPGQPIISAPAVAFDFTGSCGFLRPWQEKRNIRDET